MTLSAQQNLVWVTGCKHFHFSPKMFSCTSKCADDVNFQSFLIVLKGNRKKFNDFDITSKSSQTFQKIWEKLIIFVT